MKTKRIIKTLLCSLMVFCIALSAGISAFALSMPASEQIFLMSIERCPSCLEERTFELSDPTGSNTCAHCEHTYTYEDLEALFYDLIKESNPNLSKENLDIAVKTMMNVCPDCGKETQTKEYSMSEDGVTTTTSVAYCECGFDETKHPEVLEAKSNFMWGLMGQLLSYGVKYQDILPEEDDVTLPEGDEVTSPEEDNTTTEKPNEEKTEEETEEKQPTDSIDSVNDNESTDEDPGEILIPDDSSDESIDSDVIITPDSQNPPTGVEKYTVAALALLAVSAGALIVLKKKNQTK